MTGFRHTADCNCGCARVAGLAGEVVERVDAVDVVVLRFLVPCPAGGATRPQDVAYSCAEVDEPRPGADEAESDYQLESEWDHADGGWDR